MILLFAIIGILAVCSLPVIGFELFDRWVPVGSLWKTHKTERVIIVTDIVDGHVRYSYLSDTDSGGNASKLSFTGMTTRIPKKDEPLYFLANTGV